MRTSHSYIIMGPTIHVRGGYVFMILPEYSIIFHTFLREYLIFFLEEYFNIFDVEEESY